MNRYRIISIEAADIYRQEQENGVAVGIKMPEKNSDARFRMFRNFLDNSLDLIELEKAYKRICRKKFSFRDKFGNDYTLAVVNAIHLHGHSHFTAEATEEFLITKALNEKGYNLQIYNVGCMYWNYAPVTLDEILKTKEQRIDKE